MEAGNAWRIWDRESDYGALFYKRATGKLPEMESSKAIAKLVNKWIRPNDRILDVGCGVGHYLRSLKSEIKVPFSYVGVDATAGYIDLAKQVWADDPNARFQVGDAASLPLPDSEFDIVMCCNVLLHLPEIDAPVRELARVSRRHVLIRTLVGDRSFRIQEVYSPETHPKSFDGGPDDSEFDENGQPRSFHYYNIYSKSYISKLIAQLPGVNQYKIVQDDQYDARALEAEAERADAAPDTTQMIDGWQVNGYILQPWHFVSIDKEVAEADQQSK